MPDPFARHTIAPQMWTPPVHCRHLCTTNLAVGTFILLKEERLPQTISLVRIIANLGPPHIPVLVVNQFHPFEQSHLRHLHPAISEGLSDGLKEVVQDTYVYCISHQTHIVVDVAYVYTTDLIEKGEFFSFGMEKHFVIIN